ncbi:ethylbenzene dehydrogenase-related protein [Aliidiomarina indica]|uniref:ethylbenzene dehydrogenase-related protein n=1 Tax=Aliidiomarina indica TaxID=2749147 RepID=UPI001E5FDCBA|nr:ethylbenzene dehydrogenase-related protein [Aliidiomarina indica]
MTMSGRLWRVSSIALTVILATACSPGTDTEEAGAENGKPAGNQAQVLYVAAEYNDEKFRLHYRLEVENPSWYHQYWRFTDGEWQRMGSGADGPDPHGLYEDRISMMLDDGSVEGFARYGGWMLVHPGMRSLDSAVDSDAVQAHLLLGETMGRSDVRKYIPQSRNVERYTDQARWDDVKSEQALDEMRDRGEFLDLWQWRAHRSNPVGFADNGYVLHYRLSSEGRSMYSDNRDSELNRPAYMFDVEQTGIQSLNWDALVAREYGQDDWYYLSEEVAVPFDAEHEWQEGDVIPFRLLQTPSGARGAITADGAYGDGAWRVTLERSLASPNARDSKRLRDGYVYNVAFAVHHGSVGARHHHVSLPHRLGLGVNTGEADIIATFSEQPLRDTDLTWHKVELIYPGQVNWEWLTSQHPGAGLIKADIDIKVSDHHGYLPLFQRYIERHERRVKNTERREE